MNYFVIGDIHGCLEKLKTLLTHWNPKTEQLVFIGDYIDRGPNSKGVLDIVQTLVIEHGAWALMGNHEELLLNFLEEPYREAGVYLSNGGADTFKSYGMDVLSKEPPATAKQFIDDNPITYDFINHLPSYKETPRFIFAHAGIDPFVTDWRTSGSSFRWIRDMFHHNKTQTDKTIVFGHTPTTYLNADESATVWTKDNKICIDTGCFFTGVLTAARLSNNDGVIEYISL